jgi:type IX secretion system PorP/SprF family membrane protein
MKKSISIILITLLISSVASAQDLSMNYYSYLYNRYNTNPAFSAKGEKISAIVNFRQRSALNSTNSMVGVRGLLGNKQGLGGRLISDNRGAFQTKFVDFAYGYKLMINNEQTVYLGVSMGVINKAFNASKINNYELLDATDPTLHSSYLNTTAFTSGVGFIYDFKEFELSASSPRLIENGTYSISNVNIFASNKFFIKDKITLTPILFYFNVPVVKNLAGIQLKGEYNEKVWIQTGYQSNSHFNVGAGVNIGMLGVGYNYTFANELLKRQTSGTHEVFLTLNIMNKSQVDPTPQPSRVLTKLNSITERLSTLAASTESHKTKSMELETIKIELIVLSSSGFGTESPEVIADKLNVIDEKIIEIENKLKK